MYFQVHAELEQFPGDIYLRGRRQYYTEEDAQLMADEMNDAAERNNFGLVAVIYKHERNERGKYQGEGERIPPRSTVNFRRESQDDTQP